MEFLKWLWEGIYTNVNILITMFGGGTLGKIIWDYWLKPRLLMIKKMYDQLAILSDMLPTVQNILQEVRPNGGSSMRDAINRIEVNQTKSIQHNRALLKCLPIGTWETDERGRFISVNRTTCTMLGRVESELLGDNWVKWISDSDRMKVITEWQRCISGQSDFSMEFDFVLPNRLLKRVYAVAYQFKNEKGELLGFLGTLTSIE